VSTAGDDEGTGPGMTSRISVVVPSWRRPADLRRCLAGLSMQARAADEVVVVRRDVDLPTAEVIAGAPLDVVEVVVDRPGVIAALVAGASAATGDLLAFTDDDAVPCADWVARLLTHFADATVGAVGGRDRIQHGPAATAPPTDDVGRLSTWGRLIGNHHRGAGPPRDVSVLKGVNMAFRRAALALPLDVRGGGAQVHFEVAACLWARAHGWRLLYDPALVVDHFAGARFEGDRREHESREAARARAHNLVAGILVGRPDLLWRRAIYGLLIGQREVPGLVRAAAAIPRREWEVVDRLPPSVRGQLSALVAAVRGRGLSMWAPSPAAAAGAGSWPPS
jgi:GT2 family glycosyltransferase